MTERHQEILSSLNGDDRYVISTKYWHSLPDGKVRCDLCPRACLLREGQRGLCFVRRHIGGQIVLDSYGRSSGLCVDPVEKKPLNHFYPGTSVLSFGTAGCNLTCSFCQNWFISRSRVMDGLSQDASPDALAAVASRLGCQAVAFTYNEPVIFMEYAMDVADACRERGIATIAVSAGYMNSAPREEFYSHIDAVNIDLKGFSEQFYQKITTGRLSSVLETLEYLATTDVWLEITTLVIPGYNDSDNELSKECSWIVEHLGADVPLHFSAFHPASRMSHVPATGPDVLRRARDIACEHGLRYVYIGNIHDPLGQTTFCPTCAEPVIVRSGYTMQRYSMSAQGACSRCATVIPGRYQQRAGEWGSQRMVVHMKDHICEDSGLHDRRRYP